MAETQQALITEAASKEVFMTPREFIAITSTNVKSVIFRTDAAWEGNVGWVPDKIVEPTPGAPDQSHRVIPQFRLDLNPRLTREEMAIALISKLGSIRLQLQIREKVKTPVIIALRDDETEKARMEQSKRDFYAHNRDLIDRYLDDQISKDPQRRTVAGVLPRPIDKS